MCSQPSGDRNCSSSPSTGLPASTNPWVARSVYTVFHSTIAAVTVEAAGPVALLLEAPILISPRRLKNTARPASCAPHLCSGRHARGGAVQHFAASPDEQRVLDPAQLAQGHGQSVLARVAAELAQHQRGGDGAPLDRAGRAQDVVPVGTHVLDVQGAADQRAQRRVGLHALRHVQLGFAEVADARREAEA